MDIRLNRTHWAFWSGGKRLSLTKPPCSYFIRCSFLSLSFTFVFPPSLLFFPVPISLPGPAWEEYSPFCTYKHKTLSKMGRQVSFRQNRSTGTQPAPGSYNPPLRVTKYPALQLDSAAAKEFKNQQCWKLCNAKTGLMEHSATRYQVTVAGAGRDFLIFFFFFPWVHSSCQV